jgi:hypothetical protein
MSETTVPTSEEPKAKPAAKPKAEKPPAFEELPFDEFINKHYLPALTKAFGKQGIMICNWSLATRKCVGSGRKVHASLQFTFLKQISMLRRLFLVLMLGDRLVPSSHF